MACQKMGRTKRDIMKRGETTKAKTNEESLYAKCQRGERQHEQQHNGLGVTTADVGMLMIVRRGIEVKMPILNVRCVWIHRRRLR